MEVKRGDQSIEVDELKALLANSSERVVVIDVRTPEEFERLHIPFAINIPVDSLSDHIGALTSATKIVTACGSGGNRCKVGAAKLRELGFDNAAFLNGGTLAWHEQKKV